MRPAERLAVLKAVKVAVDAEIRDAEMGVRRVRDETGAKTFDTELGSVGISVRAASVAVVDDQAFLAWVLANHPQAVEQTVRDADRKAIIASLTVEGGDILTRDGEVVSWAAVRPGSEYVTVRLTDAAKARALAWTHGLELEP